MGDGEQAAAFSSLKRAGLKGKNRLICERKILILRQLQENVTPQGQFVIEDLRRHAESIPATSPGVDLQYGTNCLVVSLYLRPIEQIADGEAAKHSALKVVLKTR